MTLAPSYKNYSLLNRIGLSTLVTDETFGVAITPHLKGERLMIVGCTVKYNSICFFGHLHVLLVQSLVNTYINQKYWD